MKYLGVLIFAASIDAFEFLITLAVTAAGIGTTFAVGWIPVIGQAAVGISGAGGAILSTAIDTTMSAVFGSGLIAYMVLSGLMTTRDIISTRRLPFILAKFIPLVGALPFYTGMVVMSILKKKKDDSKKEGGENSPAQTTA
ncbi:MAG TPA: hypothetical protein VF803_00280 [Candidatus Paceibacterota bacterium]